MVTFDQEQSYILAAKFMDIYCISDNMLWINLENFVIKKKDLFSNESLI